MAQPTDDGKPSLRISNRPAIDRIGDLLQPSSMGSGMLARILKQRGYPLAQSTVERALRHGSLSYTTVYGDCALVVPHHVAETVLRCGLPTHAKSGLLAFIALGNRDLASANMHNEVFAFHLPESFDEAHEHASQENDADLLFYVTAFLEEKDLQQHLDAWRRTDRVGFIRGRNAFEHLGEFIDEQVQRYFSMINALNRAHGGEGLAFVLPELSLSWRASRSVILAAQRLWTGRVTHEFENRRMATTCNVNLHDSDKRVVGRYPLFGRAPVAQADQGGSEFWRRPGHTIVPFDLDGVMREYISLPPFEHAREMDPMDSQFIPDLPPELSAPEFARRVSLTPEHVPLSEATTLIREPSAERARRRAAQPSAESASRRAASPSAEQPRARTAEPSADSARRRTPEPSAEQPRPRAPDPSRAAQPTRNVIGSIAIDAGQRSGGGARTRSSLTGRLRRAVKTFLRGE